MAGNEGSVPGGAAYLDVRESYKFDLVTGCLRETQVLSTLPGGKLSVLRYLNQSYFCWTHMRHSGPEADMTVILLTPVVPLF